MRCSPILLLTVGLCLAGLAFVFTISEPERAPGQASPNAALGPNRGSAREAAQLEVDAPVPARSEFDPLAGHMDPAWYPWEEASPAEQAKRAPLIFGLADWNLRGDDQPPANALVEASLDVGERSIALPTSAVDELGIFAVDLSVVAGLSALELSGSTLSASVSADGWIVDCSADNWSLGSHAASLESIVSHIRGEQFEIDSAGAAGDMLAELQAWSDFPKGDLDLSECWDSFGILANCYRGRQIKGRVLSPTGAPVAEAAVWLVDKTRTGDLPILEETSTDSSGRLASKFTRPAIRRRAPMTSSDSAPCTRRSVSRLRSSSIIPHRLPSISPCALNAWG
jgi:hypothetical protein